MQPWLQRCRMVLCAYLVCSVNALAQDSEPAVRVALDFQAPSDCSSLEAFKRRVGSRTERIVWASTPPTTGTAKVTLDKGPGGVRVRLAWTRGDSGATVREFNAPNCEEATDAAALVIAITFDPSAPTAPATPIAGETSSGSGGASSPPPAGESPSGEEQTRPAAGETTPPENTQAEGSETQALDIPATDAGALSPKQKTRGQPSIGFSATASVEGINGVAPAPMEGFGLSAAISWGQGLFVPELRLVFVHFLGLTYPSHGGDSHFELDGARLLGCPVRLGPEAFALRPCAVAFGGRLQASGRDTINPQSHTRPFWTVGGSLMAVYRPKSVLLFTGDVSLAAPVARDSFQFAPEVFHKVETMIWGASFGVGLQFP